MKIKRAKATKPTPEKRETAAKPTRVSLEEAVREFILTEAAFRLGKRAYSDTLAHMFVLAHTQLLVAATGKSKLRDAALVLNPKSKLY
jgi:hypothetical protein